MEIKRSGSAYWHGGIKDGSGTISTKSRALNEIPYGFKSRFESGPGTNPEELIGAAHAGCFTMALSLILGQAGMTAESLKTTSTISLNQEGDGFTITAAHLDLVAKIPGATDEAFQNAAKAAEKNCPVSKLMKAEITLTATLEK
jgi:osmotically inducible protein OsmC